MGCFLCIVVKIHLPLTTMHISNRCLTGIPYTLLDLHALSSGAVNILSMISLVSWSVNLMISIFSKLSLFPINTRILFSPILAVLGTLNLLNKISLNLAIPLWTALRLSWYLYHPDMMNHEVYGILPMIFRQPALLSIFWLNLPYWWEVFQCFPMLRYSIFYWFLRWNNPLVLIRTYPPEKGQILILFSFNYVFLMVKYNN